MKYTKKQMQVKVIFYRKKIKSEKKIKTKSKNKSKKE